MDEQSFVGKQISDILIGMDLIMMQREESEVWQS